MLNSYSISEDNSCTSIFKPPRFIFFSGGMPPDSLSVACSAHSVPPRQILDPPLLATPFPQILDQRMAFSDILEFATNMPVKY